MDKVVDMEDMADKVVGNLEEGAYDRYPVHNRNQASVLLAEPAVYGADQRRGVYAVGRTAEA